MASVPPLPRYADSAEWERALDRSLQAVARLGSVDEDPEAALGHVLAEVLALIPADAAAIALKNPDSDLLDVHIRLRTPRQITTLELPSWVGVTGWVALHGEPLSVPDLSSDTRFLGLVPDGRAEMAAPIKSGSAVSGVLLVSAVSSDRFSERDLDALIRFALEAARIFDLLWTLRQLKTKADQLQSLIATGSTLISSRNTQAILHHIVSEARDLSQCDVCAIFHVDAAHNRLVLQTASNVSSSDIEPCTISLDESALSVVVQRNRQLEIYSLPRTGEFHPLPRLADGQIESLLCTPLVLEGEVIGVLNAYSSTPRRFNNDAKKILAALADLGAVAIQNSNLYARIFSTEERLRKSERLITLGMLSAEIAHEIRNPLTVIRLLFDSLDIPFADGDPRVEDTRIIREKLDHLESIVAKVLSFGGSQSEIRIPLRLDDIVAETLQLIRLKLEQQSITVVHHPGQPSPEVEVNKGQLQQVLLNLLLNSIAAMSDGGHIEIRSRLEDSGGRTLALLQISDNGGGIPPGVQSRIFESFLSATQGGTGLGLAISRRILKSHNGDIRLVRSGAYGTTFEIQLPACPAGFPEQSGRASAET